MARLAVALLRKSFRAHDVLLAGVQEARTEQGCCHNEEFARYCSGGTERRCLGVELWIARGPGWPNHKFVVRHVDPRRLLGRLDFVGSTYNVLVGHAPHRGHSVQDREEWWRRTAELCLEVHDGLDWILLLDGNCRVGSVASACIGAHQADVQDEGGACMHDLVGRLGVWLPATFAHCMEGPGGTFLQKQSQELHRCDFVGLPERWKAWQVRAWVEPSISSGHAAPDHFATIAECEIVFAESRRGKPAARIDPAAIQEPRNAERITAILNSIPEVDWSVNVNDHASTVVEHLFQSLVAAFPLKQRRMRASFLSQEAGDLHAEVARWRHALRNRVTALRVARLRCALQAWRDTALAFNDLFCGRWLSRLQTVIAVIAERIRDCGKALRQQCRRDKRLHLDGLADDVQTAQTGEVHIALKRLLRPRKFRRAGQDPLPRLKKSNGQICASHSELTETWRTHFADLEGGQITSVEELVSGCLAVQEHAQKPGRLRAEELPDLVELAQHFRSVNPQKASGPDCLPPAICRRFSCQMAVLFYPILLKTLVYAAEPIGLKGGTLFRIPKPGAPDPAALSSHRAILVQSVLEKVLHKTVRPMTVKEWDRRPPSLMIGGRKGLSYMIGYFCTRAFLEYTRRRSIPAAILFTDISSAYYSVVRELITGQHSSSASVLEIAANLALTPEDLQQLQHYVSAEPVLSGEGAGELLTALARELHCNTWFVMHQDYEVVRTQRGTRPGSSLADVLYGLLFTKVLQRRGDFSSEGWQPQVPWNGKRDIQSHDGRRQDVQQVTVQDLVYADDLATCIVERHASALAGAVRRIAGDSIDALAGHGLRANIGAKKTAALLSPVGPGSRAARRQLFSVDGGKLAVLRERGPGVWLTAVAHYRHLGSVLSFDGTLAADVRARLQSARGNFAEGKREVFCSPRIDLGRRVQLFRTHVLSALLAGSGAWPELCKKGWSLLETGLLRMLRQMLRIARHHEQNWSYRQILDSVGLPSLEDLLALERLRFLAQLVRSGPDEAFALLQLAPSFQHALRSAGRWFRDAVCNTGGPGPLDTHWHEWERLCKQPGKWRGLLRRAERWHVLSNKAEVMFQACARRLWDPVPSPVVDSSATEHACLLCRIAFYDCHSWSAHAAKVHGFRSRARRLAQGVRCQECATTFSQVIQHRRHLQVSLRCCQAVEAGIDGLYPVVPEKVGHAQGVALDGVGQDHLPPLRDAICTGLLQHLRQGQWQSTEEIFQAVVEVIEPLPVLQRTLELWIDELPEEGLRELAADARLALQADLWCEAVSNAPRAARQSGEFLDPLIVPFPSVCFDLPGLHYHMPGAQVPTGGTADPSLCTLDFEAPIPDLAGIASLAVAIPVPPTAASPFWRPLSCPLRRLEAFIPWLHQSLAWISLCVLASRKGIPCKLTFPFSQAECGVLADWLAKSSELSPGQPPLSTCFTA